MTELGTVEKWSEVGEHLPGVTEADITNIQHKHKYDNDLPGCKKDLFTVWLKRSPEDPTWSTVVRALKKIERNDLARKLDSKYGKGICIPCTLVRHISQRMHEQPFWCTTHNSTMAGGILQCYSRAQE